VLSYLKYEIFKFPWKTSWGEEYNSTDLAGLRKSLQICISEISREGKLALYWNENGLNAFTEYNRSMQNLFEGINITLNQNNYVPFHFGQALIANKSDELLKGKNVLFVSGIDDEEFKNLQKKIMAFGAKKVELYKCSSTSALNEDYSRIRLQVEPDIIFVAAGIGAAKILVDLHHLNCPVIDIGSFIHVLSERQSTAHAGFFNNPMV
jgi:hypothetical protein